MGAAVWGSSGGSVVVLGGKSFAPASVAGLFLWYKADALSLSDSDPVASWPDSSGNGRDASQATGAAQPTYRSAVQNGLPAVRTDGVNDFLALPNAMSGVLTAGSVYVAFRQRSSNAAMWKFGSFNDDSYLNFNGNVYDQFGSTTRQDTVPNNAAPAVNTFVTYNANSAAGSWSCKVDGVPTLVTGSNTVGWAAAPTIGKGPSVFGAYDWGELLLYDHVLSVPDDAAVRAYLKARWGTA